jgi:DNA-binding response OmpR family regulator
MGITGGALRLRLSFRFFTQNLNDRNTIVRKLLVGYSQMKRVLVVEDEPDIRELIVMTLRNRGYDVVGAECGEEAWIAAAKQVPQLLVLDVLLPDMDGLSLCEMFRRIPNTSKVPILMLTACATQQVRGIAENAGADDFMSKPFSPRELAHRVERLLMPLAA